jgi:2-oxoisovalerate dehydrogenase E2 component (dihydrolipoyl transacylase)
MQDFILPDIGEGIVECEVVKWLVAEGQNILEDQPVVEVMTDKALVEIPAKYSGVVSKLYYAEGEIAKVHSPLFAMQVIADDVQPSVTATEIQDSQLKSSDNDLTAKQTHVDTLQNESANETGKALASPAVRRLARELEIDLSQIKGSGDKGRVLKDDLSTTSSSDIPAVTHAYVSTGGKRVEPVRGIQAAMAKHMMHSVFTVPHFSVSDEIEMDKLMDARTQGLF